MVNVIDFNEYSSLEEALNAWLKLSLCLNVAINIPRDLPDLPISNSDRPMIGREQDLSPTHVNLPIFNSDQLMIDQVQDLAPTYVNLPISYSDRPWIDRVQDLAPTHMNLPVSYSDRPLIRQERGLAPTHVNLPTSYSDRPLIDQEPDLAPTHANLSISYSNRPLIHRERDLAPTQMNLHISNSDQPLIVQVQNLAPTEVKEEQLPSPSYVPSTSYRPIVRGRRNPFQALRPSQQELVNPPFPWATNRRAMFYPITGLMDMGITSIWGEVQCRQCDRKETLSLDLLSKFKEVESFVVRFISLEEDGSTMNHRAPPEWLNPVLPGCSSCKEPNCMRPLLPGSKREINWLFLFLSQTMGICCLRQLKWFCKHTQNHRTGAKNRVLYYCYISIGKQLHPSGVFRLFPTTLTHEVN